MRYHIILLISTIALFKAWLPCSATDNLISYGPSPKLLDVQVHILGGGSSVTQNYNKIYPRIQNQNVNMGNSWGLGAKAVFGIRDFFGFGTAIDVMLNNYNIDMAIVGSENTSMSAVFVNNRNYTINVPLFASLRMNVGQRVRWNVDLGFYYSFGFAGRQRQEIYRAEINSVDELVPEIEKISTDYYHSPRTLFNVFNRGDIGLHFSSSLDFGKHVTVGVQTQYGFKNAARPNGVDKPSIHNYSLHGTLGYRF